MQEPKKTTTVRDALRAKAGLAFDTPVPVSIDKDAIAGGRKPLPARRRNVSSLQAKVAEIYGLSALGPVQSIDAAFKFSPLESDAEFNYLHVEPLLEQASALLDRCLSHRTRWDQLQIEKWRLQLELDEFFRRVEVEEREREAGGDTLSYERAVLDCAAELALEDNHKEAEAQLKALLTDLLGTGLNRRMSAREAAAWLSAYPLKDAELRGDDAAYTFDGARKTKPEHLFDAARKEADQDAWEQVYALLVQIYSTAAQAEAARLRKESLDLHAKAALASIAYTRDKTQIARDALWEKAYQFQTPQGLLNYQERIAPVQDDFSLDFRQAIACLTAAGRGLKELYDFSPPLPQDGASYFDRVRGWVSQARNRTAQIARLDQTYVLAVSLKDLTKTQWETGLTAAAWTFDLPDELFLGQSHVRLRGLGVSVVGADSQLPKKSNAAVHEKAEGFWSARVSLPPKAALRNGGGAVRELDQKSLPVCYLGRVADQDTPGEAEIAGVRVLHNASPIGKQWKVSLSPKSTAGTPTETLQDVLLHLHLAVRG